MAKSREAFRTISEVADWLTVQTHVLRFWESKFSQVKPVKRAGGRRYYRPQDMELLGGIKKLLHEDGMSIKDVQALLRDKGVKHVSDLSQPIDLDGHDTAQDAPDQTIDVIDGATDDTENTLEEATAQSEIDDMNAVQADDGPSKSTPSPIEETEVAAANDDISLPSGLSDLSVENQPQDGPVAETPVEVPGTEEPAKNGRGDVNSTARTAISEAPPPLETSDLFASLDTSASVTPTTGPPEHASAHSEVEDSNAAPMDLQGDMLDAPSDISADATKGRDAQDLPQFLSADRARPKSEQLVSEPLLETQIDTSPEATIAGHLQDRAQPDLLQSPKGLTAQLVTPDTDPQPMAATADGAPHTHDEMPQSHEQGTSDPSAQLAEEQSIEQESTKDAFLSSLVAPQSIAPVNRAKAAALLDRLAALHAKAI